MSQFEVKSQDGKYRNTDVLDTEGIFRFIESVPSKNAEPFKLCLAKLGRHSLEDKLCDSEINKKNNLNYKYKDNKLLK